VLAGAGPTQIWFGIAIALYGLILVLAPRMRSAANWLRRGAIDRVVVGVAGGFVLLAGAALLIWYQLFRPDLSDLFAQFVPDLPLGLLLLGGVAFAMWNAFIEEVAYRGVLMEALEWGLGSRWVALIGQAVAFGTLHINGFPRGAVGVLMATIYGLMMGVVRMRSRGMFAPWVAHVVTDVIIIAILLLLAR
jgi:membrane protease YdiL (CAAX protease family)